MSKRYIYIYDFATRLLEDRFEDKDGSEFILSSQEFLNVTGLFDARIKLTEPRFIRGGAWFVTIARRVRTQAKDILFLTSYIKYRYFGDIIIMTSTI